MTLQKPYISIENNYMKMLIYIVSKFLAQDNDFPAF